MKKINFAIGALTLSLVLLSAGLFEAKVQGSNLECSSISGCCGSANCGGPGTVNGCTLTCTGGGTISCAKQDRNGICQ